jgi:hypothetical protein
VGGFINSQADNEICEALNKRFSDEIDPDDDNGLTYLEQLREHFRNREDFLDSNHKLNRVFHRLAITVTGKRVPRDKRSRHRWLFLLRKRLPRDFPEVEKAIRNQLRAVLGAASADSRAGTVSYVTFATRHVRTKSGDRFELFEDNAASPPVLSDANGKSYCTIILQCNEDKPLEDSVNEPDPPAQDSAEQDFAALTSHAAVTATESYPKRSPAKKAAGKKAAVKKAKKAKSRR